MVCLQCGAKTHITNSRLQKRSNRVWRRRQCLSCRSTFTTEESPLYDKAWLVQATDSSVEPFFRDKLLLSLYSSLEHRQTALSDASSLTDTIIKKLQGHVQGGRIWAGTIVQTALVALNRFDKAASVYYQARHKL